MSEVSLKIKLKSLVVSHFIGQKEKIDIFAEVEVTEVLIRFLFFFVSC